MPTFKAGEQLYRVNFLIQFLLTNVTNITQQNKEYLFTCTICPRSRGVWTSSLEQNTIAEEQKQELKT